MEYIFGTIQRHEKDVDILKTVGNEHTDLTGKHEIVRKYPDCTITDSFNVAEHFLSKEDAEGKCYDWYELADHYRYIDYFSPQKEGIDEQINETQDAILEIDESRLQAESDAENALIELDEAIEQRLADIENALCEITEE